MCICSAEYLKRDERVYDTGVCRVCWLSQGHCMQPAYQGDNLLTSLSSPGMLSRVNCAGRHLVPDEPVGSATYLYDAI